MDARDLDSSLHFPPKLTKRESEILPLLLSCSTRDEVHPPSVYHPKRKFAHAEHSYQIWRDHSVMRYTTSTYTKLIMEWVSDRFENLFQCVRNPVRTKDVRITKLNISVMQDALSEFKFSYVNGSCRCNRNREFIGRT